MEWTEVEPGIRVRWGCPSSRGIAKAANCYAIESPSGILLVEPNAREGSIEADLHEWQSWALGKRLSAVLVTHHHEDHARGGRLVASALQLPFWGPAGDGIERVLASGDTVSGWMVYAAPGHCDEHIILTSGSTLILGDAHEPGTGWEHELQATQRLLADLNPALALPAHGRWFEQHALRGRMRRILGGS